MTSHKRAIVDSPPTAAHIYRFTVTLDDAAGTDDQGSAGAEHVWDAVQGEARQLLRNRAGGDPSEGAPPAPDPSHAAPAGDPSEGSPPPPDRSDPKGPT